MEDPRFIDVEMTETMMLKVMDFIMDKLPKRSNFHMFFWGGEPLLKFDLIKKTMSEFPQYRYNTSTNGIAIDEEVYDFVFEKRMLNVTWSLGYAYEKYGGIREMAAVLPWAVKLVKDCNARVNFMVTDFSNMYEDFKFIYNYLTKNITIDVQLKYHYTDDELEAYVDNYARILDDYDFSEGNINNGLLTKSALWHQSFGNKVGVDEWLFCRSGLDRVYFDPLGRIWQCDGFYLANKNQLGDIDSGIDYSRLAEMERIAGNTKLMSKYCNGCEIFGICPRKKCLGINMEINGDMLKPDPGYCKVNKALIKIIRRHKDSIMEKREVHCGR